MHDADLDVGAAGAQEIDATNSDRISSTVDMPSRPSASGQPMATASSDTVGMVRPMVAMAEPSARLRLVCTRSLIAAHRGHAFGEQHDRRDRDAGGGGARRRKRAWPPGPARKFLRRQHDDDQAEQEQAQLANAVRLSGGVA